MYLSVSKIKSFETCKLQYKWLYIDKIYKPVPPTEEQLFGIYLHRFIELYPEKEVAEIVELLNEEMEKGPFLGKELIEAIVNTVKFLKQFDNYKKRAEHKINVNLNRNIKLGGKIDRLYMSENNNIVIDFKTSKNFYQGFNDLQLKFYSLLVHKKYNIDPEKIEVIAFYSRPNKYERKSFNDEDIMYFIRYLEDIVDKMLTINEFPPTQNNLCRFCAYKDSMCPLFNGHNNIS